MNRGTIAFFSRDSWMPLLLHRLHLECRDARELVARPWWVGMVNGGRLPHGWVNRAETTRGEQQAADACARFDLRQAQGFMGRQRAWRLAERADVWRAQRLGDRLPLDALAAALPSEPALFLASHAGSGQGLWTALKRLKRRTFFVAKPPVDLDFGHARVARAYGRWRGQRLRRSGCEGIIGTGGAASAIQSAWNRGDDVLVLPDAPGEGRHCWAKAGPGALRVRTGALSLAQAAGVPLVVFDFGGDPWTGERTLDAIRLAPLPIEAAAAAFADVWFCAMARDAAAWPLWGYDLWRPCSSTPFPEKRS